MLICAAAVAAAHFDCAAAQSLTRLKAKLIAFDGQVMIVQPLTQPDQGSTAKAGDAVANPPAINVLITPDTRFVGSQPALFSDIKVGNYAGATVGSSAADPLKAREIFLYDDALRGTGEGRFPEGDHVVVNGTVTAVKPGLAKEVSMLTLHYHGSVLTGLGRGKSLCEGRAAPPAFASALACESDAVISVPPDAPVSWMRSGDKSLLVPGRLVTVALSKTADGKDVTPGVLVEKSPPAPVEKPQSPH